MTKSSLLLTFTFAGNSKDVKVVPPILVMGDGPLRLLAVRFISDDNYFMSIAGAKEVKLLGISLVPEYTHRVKEDTFEFYAKVSTEDLEKVSLPLIT